MSLCQRIFMAVASKMKLGPAKAAHIELWNEKAGGVNMFVCAAAPQQRREQQSRGAERGKKKKKKCRLLSPARSLSPLSSYEGKKKPNDSWETCHSHAAYILSRSLKVERKMPHLWQTNLSVSVSVCICNTNSWRMSLFVRNCSGFLHSKRKKKSLIIQNISAPKITGCVLSPIRTWNSIRTCLFSLTELEQIGNVCITRIRNQP